MHSCSRPHRPCHVAGVEMQSSTRPLCAATGRDPFVITPANVVAVVALETGTGR